MGACCVYFRWLRTCDLKPLRSICPCCVRVQGSVALLGNGKLMWYADGNSPSGGDDGDGSTGLSGALTAAAPSALMSALLLLASLFAAAIQLR